MTLANVDDKGYAEVTADCEGEGKVRLDGSYLTQILKACGGAVDFKVNSPHSPVLFSSDGFQVVAMPMVTATTPSQPAEAKAEAEGATDVVAQAEAVASEAAGKPKRKRKGKGKAKAEAPADEPLEDEVGELPPDQAKEPVAVTS